MAPVGSVAAMEDLTHREQGGRGQETPSERPPSTQPEAAEPAHPPPQPQHKEGEGLQGPFLRNTLGLPWGVC